MNVASRVHLAFSHEDDNTFTIAILAVPNDAPTSRLRDQVIYIQDCLHRW